VSGERHAVYRQVPEGFVAFVEEMTGASTQGVTLDEDRPIARRTSTVPRHRKKRRLSGSEDLSCPPRRH
jgi:hypothetical protein